MNLAEKDYSEPVRDKISRLFLIRSLPLAVLTRPLYAWATENLTMKLGYYHQFSDAFGNEIVSRFALIAGEGARAPSIYDLDSKSDPPAHHFSNE